MRIEYSDFRGEVPARSAKLLPPNYAQTAENVDLDMGVVKPVANLLQGDPTVWTFVDESGVDVTPANVSGVSRLLVSGLTEYPEARQGTTTRRWGVITPTTIPAFSTAGTAGDEVTDSVSYRYSYVTAWGEESGLSDASATTDVMTGEYIILNNFTIPTIAGSGNDVSYIRVYRTASTSDGSTAYQQVPLRETVSGTATYDIPASSISNTSTQLFDVNSSEDGLNQVLGDVQVTDGWDPPPDAAEGGIEFSNGVYALFKNKKLYLSVPGYYYAFPSSGLLDYTFEFQYDIVGLGAFSNQLVVCTEAFPAVISGVDPQSASKTWLSYQQPCLSKKSVVSLPHGVFYVSKNGGFLVDGGENPIITKNLFTRSQWNEYPLSSAICAYWQGNIYVFFSGQTYGFAIDFTSDSVIKFADIGVSVSDLFVDEEADALYISDGTDWYKWRGGSGTLKSTYRTAPAMTGPTSFSCARISGENLGDVTSVKVIGGDEILYLSPVATGEAFRLPGGRKKREWCFELELDGDAEVDGMFIAQGMNEL